MYSNVCFTSTKIWKPRRIGWPTSWKTFRRSWNRKMKRGLFLKFQCWPITVVENTSIDPRHQFPISFTYIFILLSSLGSSLVRCCCFFRFPFLPAFLCQSFLAFISVLTGFHDWGLVTRWAQLLITYDYSLPSTSKDLSKMRAELTE